MKKSSLKFRLISTGILITTIPVIVAALVTWQQMTHIKGKVAEAVLQLSAEDFSHLALSVKDQASVAYKLLNEQLGKIMGVAEAQLKRSGPITFSSSETVPWTAVNQFDKSSVSVTLPKVSLNDQWLGQVEDAGTFVPVVDHVRQETGDTATIFQRMNDAGDMLRVATSVIKADGKRAIGTYIPALNPNGTPNPVIAAVLKGETFTGRAFVVDQWYLAAYKPILDAEKKVVGILYVGVPEKTASTQLRESITSRKIGKSGYIFVVNAKGDNRGKYVVSYQGKRDGENIYGAKDNSGKLFIKEIIDKAIVLKSGEVGREFYPWQNKDESAARMKVAYFTYFEPWDWVIGVSSYEEEYMGAVYSTDDMIRSSLRFQLILVVVATAIATISFFLIAGKISREISGICENLVTCSKETVSAANQVSSASQVLATGSSEQAAALEESSASMEEMTSMTKRNAENSESAKGIAQDARTAAEKAAGDIASMSDAMSAVGASSQQLRVAMDKIQSSSTEITQIMKTIDEIAFQTNILSLNAAVEAARAGEAGAGFAVVADEVRALAQRSADAAKQTARMIKESSDSSHQGSQVTEKVAADLNNMNKTAQKVSDSLKAILGKTRQVDEVILEISTASKEQSIGITQVGLALNEMDKVTQSNAASAEETAAAAEELNGQSMELNHIVAMLEDLIKGTQKASQQLHQDNGFKSALSVSKKKPSSSTAKAPARSSQREAIPMKATAPPDRNSSVEGSFIDQ